ncbi:protein MANNAN SYNTHESIS-RELATED 1-like [Corylus avellana]|uniref:protein MANNAN SYNTHESIS-RELATED 1-like n=1 Tax=Corylus avellana TaxID=13451 RepID=UPI00286C950C|nr:protein MANNAN SYNTHESIS-RELATED 1-like [Corylus avellana]
MGVDLRQVVAGILTLTMFVMLGNMIKRDHFDSAEEKLPGGASNVNLDGGELGEQGLVSLSKRNGGLWKEDDQQLKPCWDKPVLDDVEPTDGFVTFSLTNGPEYHVSQIVDAVVVARYLGATLVLPDIRGSKPGDERSFEDIYDVEKFVKSLDGVVRVVKEQPAEISTRNLAVVKVPNRVTEDYIVEHVKPIYKHKGNIRLATYFPSVNMRKSAKNGYDSVACLAVFGTLQLQPKIQEVVDSMVERLRTLSRKSDGQFIAVDLRVDMLEKKGCLENGEAGTRSCYNAQEIAVFLRKIGFDKDTPVYLTESRWESSLDALKDHFPKTYTKESIIPADKKAKFLDSEGSEYEKVIDFYICSQSDVFVPAISGLFYSNVAGKRIAAGRTQILVPANIPESSASASDFITHYVSKKNHLAYSCFC